MLEYDFFVLFLVNPATLARYRRAFAPSRAKDDPTDAQIAVEPFLRHRDKLSVLERQSNGMRALRRLVEVRRDLQTQLVPAGPICRCNGFDTGHIRPMIPM